MAQVKVPSVGESITEVTIGTWLKEDGDYVEVDEPLCEIESDKATVELPAEVAGALKIQVAEGETVAIESVIAEIDESASGGAAKKEAPKKEEQKEAAPAAQSAPAGGDKNYPSPAAKKILDEKGVDASSVSGSGKDGRITKADAQGASAAKAPAPQKSPQKSFETQVPSGGASREVRREKMTSLRKTIAKRLLEAKNSTAMLTTFNEVDMHNIMSMRKQYKEAFKEKHEVGLGFMSLFTKAVTMALRDFPVVNAQIEGTEVLYHDYADIGVAVSTPKGLVVPVIRNAESLTLAQIEKEVLRLALKARDGKLTLAEMQGGSFTITNGGVFGSMLSTPIINIPQSAILGMHNIVQRPWVVNGEIKVRPIMYVALSYDHRLIDGKDSVSFLKRVKELIEDPQRLLLDV